MDSDLVHLPPLMTVLGTATDAWQHAVPVIKERTPFFISLNNIHLNYDSFHSVTVDKPLQDNRRTKSLTPEKDININKNQKKLWEKNYLDSHVG